MEGKTGVQKCWELKMLIDVEPPSTLDGTARAWLQPCRPPEEREHRNILNQARRFLHVKREDAGIATKLEERGSMVAVIGGKYYSVAKACIAWKGKTVVLVEGAIEWSSNDNSNDACKDDFTNFEPLTFKKSWTEFLR